MVVLEMLMKILLGASSNGTGIQNGGNGGSGVIGYGGS